MTEGSLLVSTGREGGGRGWGGRGVKGRERSRKKGGEGVNLRREGGRRMVEGEQSRGRGQGVREIYRVPIPKSVLYLCHVLCHKVDGVGIQRYSDETYQI